MKTIKILLILFLVFGLKKELSSQTYPKANADTFYFYRNTWALFPVLKNDYDTDANDTIKLLSIVTPSKYGIDSIDVQRGYIKYTSNSTYIGFDSLEYSIIDKTGLKDTAKVYFNINYWLSIVQTKKEKMELYPNPAKNIVYINNYNNSKNSKVYFFNVQGALLKQESISNETNSIKIDELFKGIYTVVIQEENRRIQVEKIIVE